MGKGLEDKRTATDEGNIIREAWLAYTNSLNTPLLLNCNIMINSYTSACEGLRNATPKHAKIRRGMDSWWIDERLMFSIWRQNQNVKN